MARYRVPDDINHLILGHFPGDTFDADIPAAQEARLVGRGQLIAEAGLAGRTRGELDEVARGLSLNPDEYPNKPSLIDAIQAETQKAGD